MIIDFIKFALCHLQDEICEFLIDKGADVDAMEPRIVIEPTDDRDYVV